MKGPGHRWRSWWEGDLAAPRGTSRPSRHQSRRDPARIVAMKIASQISKGNSYEVHDAKTRSIDREGRRRSRPAMSRRPHAVSEKSILPRIFFRETIGIEERVLLGAHRHEVALADEAGTRRKPRKKQGKTTFQIRFTATKNEIAL